MSTSATRKGRRKLWLLATVVGAVGLFLAFAGNAFGSVSCSYNSVGVLAPPATLTVTISDDVPGNSPAGTANKITITRSGQTILVNGVTCVDPTVPAAATVTNVAQINVVPINAIGAQANDTLTIDTSNGPFAPGFTAGIGSPALNYIPFYVNLGGATSTATGFGNKVVVIGSSAADGIVAGQDGATAVVAPGSCTGPQLAASCWLGTVPTLPAAVDQTGVGLTPVAGDLLINLNAGPLTDATADVWVINRGLLEPSGVANGACPTALIDGSCTVSKATFDLGLGNNSFLGKGGDGTGQPICNQGIVDQTVFSPDFDPLAINLTITAGAGDDTIIGGECSDFISAGGGTDFVDGNGPAFSEPTVCQDDLYAVYVPLCDGFVGDVADFSSLAGPATITLNENGTMTLTGIPGQFVGFEHVIGTKGNDTINGNSFDNFLAGAGGNDTIHGNGGDDIVDGDDAAGVAASGNTAGDDTLFGDAGQDVVLGDAGDDTINENTGVNNGTSNSTEGDLPLTNGADAISGGDGTDTVLYDERTTTIVVYLGLISTFNDGADLNNDGLSNEYDDVYFDTENVKTGSGNDIVSANFVNNRANNVFTDNGGNDCLEGGPGNDQFIQGSAPQGADVMIGNTGADWADYSGRSAAVQVALDGVANDGDIATNEGDNVGGFSVTCRPATVIVNPPFSSNFFPLFGDNNGDGFVDNAAFQLEAPVAGPAPQFCDFILRARSTAGIGISSGFCAGETLGGDQSPLSNVDVENVNGGSGDDKLVGDAAGNVLNGNAGNDTINGGANNDQLNGGDGDDTIAGGTGNDAIDGGAGTNTADYASAGSGGVGVQVNLTTGVGTGDGNDTLKSISNVNGSSFSDSLLGDGNANVLNGNGAGDAINGNAGDDTVNGGDGADQLKGAAGADKITGAQGNDAMQGGSEDDWLQGGQGRDTILGQKGNDKLYGNAQPDFLNGGPGSDKCKPGSPGLARGDVVVNCES